MLRHRHGRKPGSHVGRTHHGAAMTEICVKPENPEARNCTKNYTRKLKKFQIEKSNFIRNLPTPDDLLTIKKV
jgi:hypothetical protein